MNIKETAKSPFAKVSGGIAAILTVLNPEMWFVTFEALLASAPQLFSVASVGALTLPQVLPPQSTTDWVVVGAGVLFLAYSVRTVSQKFDERGL
ncbi:hypothetical protein DJ73_02180 [Halorubrum sp. Ea1]|uniref:hypothetical protein n=1 Tax=Halorubrum sp. Ea1 TaxID=1480718 RepID=UPI000B99979F|nr:hypothetical protein [Halorubrum sp. Ea1]OYR55529.1 hypothetical protein DJ73_02180 [Halorubrum sp. Ea1]